MSKSFLKKDWVVTFSAQASQVLAAWLIAVFAQPSLAQSPPVELEIPLKVTTSSERVVEFLVQAKVYHPPAHLSSPTDSHVILTHGIINSDGIVQKLAEKLAREGFTVWTYNQPGFGQERRITMAMNGSVRGDYGITALAGAVDAMARLVTKQTGQKPIFIGYSLGGVALRLHLNGLQMIDADGRPHLNSRLANQRQQALERAVFISAPALTTEDMPRGLRLLYESARCANCVFGHREGFLDLGLGQEKSLTGSTLGISTRWTPEIVLRSVFRDVTVWENLDPESRNIADYLKRNFSNIHTDLLQDLTNSAKHFSQIKLPPPKYVPTLQIVGTKDGIADHKKMLETPRSPNHEVLLVEGVGHLDILENKVLDSGLARDLVKRIRPSTDRLNPISQPRQLSGASRRGLGRCEGSFLPSGLF